MFRYQSGRVIALGRSMLASLFLLSIWVDQSQPAHAPAQTYLLLLFYVSFAIVIALLTWRNWWLDARLAMPAHIVDMATFTGIVFSTHGYTSPFFLFFVLPLLSAAIRWGWRETMLTATALVLLYLTAGLLVSGSESFELQRFIVRSGHLIILSALLIWFGIHQQFARLFFGLDGLDRRRGREDDPLVHALALATDATGARSGALLLKTADGQQFAGVRHAGSRVRPVACSDPLIDEAILAALFDTAKNRCLTRQGNGWNRFVAACDVLNLDALRELAAVSGLIAEVRTGTEQGWLLLWDVPDLSVDFLELGPELARAAGAALDHDALLSAIEEGAAARTRLSLARDVHDSVVQFLAGATFRVEAIIRGAHSGGEVEPHLQELKRLLIEEQGQIREFVSTLRRDRELDFSEAIEELKTLAARLGQQWSVDCRLEASNGGGAIPIRMQFDLQQLLREAVANAVRHGGANRIEVGIVLEQDQLRLEVKDNGSGFLPVAGEAPVQPWSLKERVDRSRGSLSLLSKCGYTNVVITLPLAGAAT